MALNIGDPVQVEGWSLDEGFYVLSGVVTKYVNNNEVQVEFNTKFNGTTCGLPIPKPYIGQMIIEQSHFDMPLHERLHDLELHTQSLISIFQP